MNMKQKHATRLNIVGLDKYDTNSEQDLSAEIGLYKYQTSEQNGDKIRWATHFIWRKNTYTPSWVVEKTGMRFFFFFTWTWWRFCEWRIDAYSRRYSSTPWVGK